MYIYIYMRVYTYMYIYIYTHIYMTLFVYTCIRNSRIHTTHDETQSEGEGI